MAMHTAPIKLQLAKSAHVMAVKWPGVWETVRAQHGEPLGNDHCLDGTPGCQLWISEVTNFAWERVGTRGNAWEPRPSIATQHFQDLPGGDPGHSEKCEELLLSAALLLQSNPTVRYAQDC